MRLVQGKALLKATVLVQRLLRRFWRSRRTRLAVASLLLIVWLTHGRDLVSGGDPRARLGEYLDYLVDSDPVAADLVESLESQATLDSLALAVDVRLRSQDQWSDSFGDFVHEIHGRGTPPRDVLLGALTLEDLAEWSADDRQGFIYGYGSLFAFLEEAHLDEKANALFSLLQDLRREPGRWERVKGDPMALTLLHVLGDPNLLDVYLDNAEWLGSAMESLPLPDGEDCTETLRAVLTTVRDYPGDTRHLAVDEGTGGLGLPTFAIHRELVVQASRAHGIPLEEVVTVLTLNPDSVELLGDEDFDRAARLAFLREQFPLTWAAAQLRPFSLRLALIAPSAAENVIEDWEHMGASSLLYSSFGGGPAEQQAIHAVAKFGDLALFVFSRWGAPDQLERISGWLVQDDLGVRTVPFILRFGDEAFVRIVDDPAWVERYFLPNGDERPDTDWLSSIPLVGSAGHALSMKLQGYPLEFSEVAWAAVDVADIAIAAATLGGSKVATTGVKVAAKAGARTLVEESAEAVARQTIRARAKRWLAEAAGSSIHGVRDAKARFASVLHGTGSRKGLRRAFTELAPGLFRTSGKVAAGSARLAFGALRGTVSGSIHALGATGKAVGKLPQLARSRVARAFLAVSILTKIVVKTVPELDAIAAGVGRFAGEVAGKTVQATSALLASAVQGFAAQLTGSKGFGTLLAHYGLAALFVFLLARELLKSPQAARLVPRRISIPRRRA